MTNHQDADDEPRERDEKPLPSKPSAGHLLGGLLAGVEHVVTGRSSSVPQIEEPYNDEWASAEGMTVQGLEEPIDRPEPPDRSGARL